MNKPLIGATMTLWVVALAGSAGTAQLLTGSTETTPGTRVRHRFAEDGRYLVICINRVHSINDWMFGFVNVV